jgi:hypothetical protein
MGSIPQRADAAFWVDGNTVRALALTDATVLKTSEAGTIEFPPLREDTIAAPMSKPIALVEILARCERQISYCLIIASMIVVAAISVSATSAGIAARDLSVNIENLRGETSMLERQLEDARRTPPPTLGKSGKVVLPLDSDNVVYVQLPKAR